MWSYIGTIADDHFFVNISSGTEERQVYLRSSHGGCGANGAIGYNNLCRTFNRDDSALLLAAVGPEFMERQERFGNRNYYDILRTKKPCLISILYQSERPTTSFDVEWTPPEGKKLSKDTLENLRKLDFLLTQELYDIPMRLRKRVEKDVCEWAQTYKIKPGSMKDFEDVKIVREFLRYKVLPSVGSEALKKISIVGGTLEMQDVVIGTLRSLPSTKESLIRYTPASAIYSLKKAPLVYMSRDEFIRKILTKVDILQLNKSERYHLMGGSSRALYDLLNHRFLRNGRLKIVLCTSKRYVSDYYRKSSDLALKAFDATEMGIGHVYDFLCQRKEKGDIGISGHRPNVERIEGIKMKVQKNRIEKGEINDIKRTDFLVPEIVKRVSAVGAGDAFGCGVDFELSQKL